MRSRTPGPKRVPAGSARRSSETRAKAWHMRGSFRRLLYRVAPRQTGTLVTVVEPPQRWFVVDWKELLLYSELFLFLVWRDLKTRYRQTLLGAAWAVVVPLVQMVVFTVLFKKAAELDTNGMSGAPFYYAALLPWNYFAGSLGKASGSLLVNASFLTKIYCPRLIIPTSACIGALVDFAIAFTILVPILFYFQVLPGFAALLLPLLLFVAFSTAVGAGMLFSSLNVKYRDVHYLLPFFMQVWMYCTVIVPFSEVVRKFGAWGYLYGLNPMAGVVEGFRWCLFHAHCVGAGIDSPLAGPFPWILLAMGLPVVALLLTVGLAVFKHMERSFADII